MATGKLIVMYTNSKTGPGPIHKLKAIKRAMNSIWRALTVKMETVTLIGTAH